MEKCQFRGENSNEARNDEVGDDSIEEDNITEMIHDACGYTNGAYDNFSEDNEETNIHATKFYKLLEDAQIELYPSYSKVSKLLLLKYFT